MTGPDEMTNPPRRSRPRKPVETIDLNAERLGDYPPQPRTDAPGDHEPAAGSGDPEARLGEGASPAPEALPPQPEGIAVLGEPEPGDFHAPLAASAAVDRSGPADGTTAEGGFAAEEGLRRESRPEDGPQEELDAETILAAAEPQPAAPPRPELDYHRTSSQPAAEHGPGLGTVLGAALIGAALALLLGGILQYAGIIPAVRQQDVAQLTQQFARVGDVQQIGTDLNTVRADLGQLQSTLSAGGAGGTGPTGADFAALADRFNGLEGRLNSLADAGASPPAGDPNALNGLTQAANEARDTAGQARQAAEGAGAQAAEARQTATTAQQAAGTAQQAADVAQTAADGAMNAAKANAEAIADIRNRVGSVEAANRQAAVAFSAASLKAAVDRGGPFMTELETYATAAGPSPVVDGLRNYAAEGVPTVATLEADWPNVRTAILQALRPQDPNADVGSQILSGLSSLVAVRPSASAGSAAGGPDAPVARLDAMLQAGNLQGWNAEWQKLPQAAKDAGAAFQSRVNAREQAERVVDEALGQAVNSIGKAG